MSKEINFLEFIEEQSIENKTKEIETVKPVESTGQTWVKSKSLFYEWILKDKNKNIFVLKDKVGIFNDIAWLEKEYDLSIIDEKSQTFIGKEIVNNKITGKMVTIIDIISYLSKVIDLENIDFPQDRFSSNTTKTVIKDIMQKTNVLNMSNDIVSFNNFNILLENKKYSKTDLKSINRINFNFVDYRTKERLDDIKFINEQLDIWSNGDKDTKKLLLELIGYCLTPNTREGKFFELFGPAGTGKSSFLEVLSKIFQTSYRTITWSDFNNRFWATKLIGTNVLAVQDSLDGNVDKIKDKVKSLATGDFLDVEFKGKTPFTFKPYAKLIVATNNPISWDRLKSNDSGSLEDRHIRIVFDNRLRNTNKADKNYIKQWTSERVETLVSLSFNQYATEQLINGKNFTVPKKSKDNVEKQTNNENPIITFLEDLYSDKLEDKINSSGMDFKQLLAIIPINDITNTFFDKNLKNRYTISELFRAFKMHFYLTLNDKTKLKLKDFKELLNGQLSKVYKGKFENKMYNNKMVYIFNVKGEKNGN